MYISMKCIHANDSSLFEGFLTCQSPWSAGPCEVWTVAYLKLHQIKMLMTLKAKQKIMAA